MNVKEVVLENSDQLIDRWVSQLDNDSLQDYTSTISGDMVEQMNKEFAEVVMQSLKEENNQLEVLDQFAEKVVNLGWPFGYIAEGLQAFRTESTKFVLDQLDTDSKEEFVEVMESVNNWIDPLKIRLMNQYSTNWNNILSMQKLALEELSAPLIPVMDEITVMPLVGTIDTDRAKLIMENLLNGVVKNRTDVVLIDITGVPVVDTMVAHHIIQAAEAVRLLGATCILVGIRPEIAQTIVNLGIDLSQFPTKSSLKKGFETALQMTEQQIVSKDSRSEDIEEILDSVGKE
ncbi:STAS domain-containing protein [Alkalibacillus salilacus]|uniref:RsbT co-antagonist protein RsbR n=1 Tax=Alkalibacillus salilacus TaxID=284582 RepID=A0ABT9VE23_9BACI|nr:STAS domain-containing protein [Alkalibacillus salilacus]MDQ0159221.1 rsbT co-antagonist protein RsbR [Alkalibacillus salilacus]